MDTFGKRLRCYRNKARLTQYQLAKLSKVSLVQIARFETEATKHPKIETVEKLAKALNISTHKLMFGVEPTVFDVGSLGSGKVKRKNNILPQEAKIRVTGQAKNHTYTFNSLITPSSTTQEAIEFINDIKKAFLKYFRSIAYYAIGFIYLVSVVI